MEMDKVLLYEAGQRLREIGNIRNAWRWIRQNPEGFAVRVYEFNNAQKRMNEILMGPLLNLNLYGNVLALRDNIGGKDTPLMLDEAIGMYGPAAIASGFGYYNLKVHDTFRLIADKTASEEWKFATSITDNPNQLASALLIEGYGLFIEQLYETPLLGKKFVLGIEEVLFNTQPNARLLKDVLGWMKAESGDFSPGVASKLRTI